MSAVRVRIGLLEVEHLGVLRRLSGFTWEGTDQDLEQGVLAEEIRLAVTEAKPVVTDLPDPATVTAPARKLLARLVAAKGPNCDDEIIRGAGEAAVVRSLEARGIVLNLHGRATIFPEAREWARRAVAQWEGGGA